MKFIFLYAIAFLFFEYLSYQERQYKKEESEENKLLEVEETIDHVSEDSRSELNAKDITSVVDTKSLDTIRPSSLLEQAHVEKIENESNMKETQELTNDSVILEDQIDNHDIDI